MEGSRRMKLERKNDDWKSGNDDKDDDDVSVIAVIGKENDRYSRQRNADEKSDEKRGDRRVFELSDEQTKMALRKQLDMELLSTEEGKEAENYDDMDILWKLPPETIVIKQQKKYKDHDSDYVRDSTETSSGGSTSGGGAPKVKRVHRATRKSRGAVEVRRNPIRVTKKDPNKNFSRPRQRLLSAKRKEMLLDCEPTKRGKSCTMPYMNTRSVTRKMYNVGATYQAPTKRDETEWKEWPVHGMHERPVFHPQIGLAAEYLGRYFVSLDDLSYREIIDRPEIEVVSVDPHSDFLPSSTEKKRSKKTKSAKSSCSSKPTKTSLKSTDKNKSFESCMHESFHCVLGYCSQVLNPTYKTNVEGKLSALNDTKNPTATLKGTERQSSALNIVDQSFKNEACSSFKENLQKPSEETKCFDNYTVAMFPQKSFASVPKTRLFPAQKVYMANSQKSIGFTNFRTFQGGQMKIQDVMRSSKSPFILVNPSDAKEASQISKPISGNLNVIKVDESSSVTEETLGELPSIYRNESNEEATLKQAQKRANKVEFTVTKYLLDNMQQNKFQLGKESTSGEKKLCFEASNKESAAKTVSGNLNKAWCTSETSEIAKILSEYNKSTLKKPAIQNHTFCANAKNTKVKELCKKDENVAKQSCADRNVNITFPQGKWRRFHLTVEKLKDLKGNSNEKRLASTVQSRQSMFKMDPIIGESSFDKKEASKQLEALQRAQSLSFEKKESPLKANINNNVDTITVKTQSLQELLENTAVLYCAATGTHQDDLANYVDSLDAAQSIKWLEACNN